MLEITPLGFIDPSPKERRIKITYGVFMLIVASSLFFDREIIAGLLVLAAWIIPMIIDLVFPGFYESKIVRGLTILILVAAMIFVLAWMYQFVSRM